MSDTPNSCVLSCDNPWLGMQSFSEAEKNFFFGREKEVDELFRMVRRERLTVFYGKSGLGKSSLLCAGLYPRLRDSSMIPVPIRLDFSGSAPAPKDQVISVFQDTLRTHGIEFHPVNREESLWAYFHDRRVDFWDSRNRLITPVLCFDQFEECFTVGHRNEEAISGVDLLLNELSALLENRPPASLLASFEDEYKQKKNLETEDDSASRFDFDKTTCKVVFTLREDYLPELSSLSNWFPSILGNMLRLQCMDEPQAKEVVLKAGRHLVSDEVADEIIRFVACAKEAKQLDRTMEVEPVLLNVVLYELNRRRLVSKQTHIDFALLSGKRDEIICNFYEMALLGMPKSVRHFIEEALLTDKGRRDSCAWENAVEKYGIDGGTLGVLIKRNIIRREERPSGTRLELVHERLAGVVERQRKLRRLFRRRVRILSCAAGVLVVGLAFIAGKLFEGHAEFGRFMDRFMEKTTLNVERMVFGRQMASEIFVTQLAQPITDSLFAPPPKIDVYYLISSNEPPNAVVDSIFSPVDIDDNGIRRKMRISPGYIGFLSMGNVTTEARINERQLAGLSTKFFQSYENNGSSKFSSLYIGLESGVCGMYPWREYYDKTYDPRTRPWYHLCKTNVNSATIISYEFASTKDYGSSCVKALIKGDKFLGAICVDILVLEDLFYEFQRQLTFSSRGKNICQEKITVMWLESNKTEEKSFADFRVMSSIDGLVCGQGECAPRSLGKHSDKGKTLFDILPPKTARSLQKDMLDATLASGTVRTVFEQEDVWCCWVRTPTTDGTVGTVIALIPRQAFRFRRLFAGLD